MFMISDSFRTRDKNALDKHHCERYNSVRHIYLSYQTKDQYLFQIAPCIDIYSVWYMCINFLTYIWK